MADKREPLARGHKGTDRSLGGPVDLKALALHLGLSKGTISRALNGYPEIADATRARVLKAAEELGYRPNRAARRLATGRNDLIAYVALGADRLAVDRKFLRQLSGTLSTQGYGLIVSVADTMDHAVDAMDQLIDERRVDGFVFNTPWANDARIAKVMGERLPASVVGNDGSRTRAGAIPTIGIRDEAVLDGLVDYLNSLGHQRFAYFGCDAPRAEQTRHATALQASCGNRGLEFAGHMLEDNGPDYGVPDEDAAQLMERATDLLNSSSNVPTSVFCGCERTVVALYMAARERGLRVPAELSIIGIGSSELASWLSGGLSTVSWSMGEAGRLAAESIVAQVEGQQSELPAVTLEAEFLARASHGPAPALRL